MRVKFLSVLLFSSALISSLYGCNRLEDLQRIKPHGTEFQNVLMGYYTDFAAAEAKQYDWLDSQHFIDKAMKIAYGHKTYPEDPRKWNIPKDILPQMLQARENLVNLLDNTNVTSRLPKQAAKAQFYFDCWVEQQEENWQIEDIQTCRDNFYEFLAKISNSAPENSRNATSILDIKDKHSEQVFHLILADGKEHISMIAEKELHKATAQAKQYSNPKIIVSSYSYKQPTEEANIKLAKSRATSVKQKLQQKGIKEDDIEIIVFPEPKPMANSLNEPKGRDIIEIIISEDGSQR